MYNAGVVVVNLKVVGLVPTQTLSSRPSPHYAGGCWTWPRTTTPGTFFGLTTTAAAAVKKVLGSSARIYVYVYV
jgi:hypothetical protein